MKISLRPWKLKSRIMGGLISPAKTHLGVARGRLRRIEEGEAIHELTKGRQLIRDATHFQTSPICFHSKRNTLLSSHYDWEKSQFLTCKLPFSPTFKPNWLKAVHDLQAFWHGGPYAHKVNAKLRKIQVLMAQREHRRHTCCGLWWMQFGKSKLNHDPMLHIPNLWSQQP